MEDAGEYLNRRAELLYLARKTRLRWLGEASGENEAALGARTAEMENLLSSMPALRCLEDVLGFLTDITNDSEAVQLTALISAHALPDEDEDEDEDSSSLANMTPYACLLAKLKRKSSTEIVKTMQSFVQGVEIEMRGADFAESIDEKLGAVATTIWAFLKKILGIMRDDPSWKEESNELWDKTKDYVEKFLFTKLHKTLFVEDPAGDREMEDRMDTLRFLSPEHLDIRSVVGDGVAALEIPIQILQDTFSTAVNPSDKVQCLRECSAAISKILSARKEDGGFAGADEFLPVLILTVKEANPKQLKSNLRYITTFTNPSKLASEAGYLLTQFMSAVSQTTI